MIAALFGCSKTLLESQICLKLFLIIIFRLECKALVPITLQTACWQVYVLAYPESFLSLYFTFYLCLCLCLLLLFSNNPGSFYSLLSSLFFFYLISLPTQILLYLISIVWHPCLLVTHPSFNHRAWATPTAIQGQVSILKLATVSQITIEVTHHSFKWIIMCLDRVHSTKCTICSYLCHHLCLNNSLWYLINCKVNKLFQQVQCI